MNDLIQRIGFKERTDAGFQKIDGPGGRIPVGSVVQEENAIRDVCFWSKSIV